MSETLIELTVLQHDSTIRQLQEEQAARIVLQEEQAATIRQLQEEKTARIQQQCEIKELKELTVTLQTKVHSHWHFVGTDTTNKTFFN